MAPKYKIVFIVGLALAIAPLALVAAQQKNRNNWASIWATVDNLSKRMLVLENQTPIPVPDNQPSDQSTNAPLKPPKRRYKILTNADICTLNKLGQDGWEIVNFGQPIDIANNLDENCKTAFGSPYKGLDSVVLQKVDPQ